MQCIESGEPEFFDLLRTVCISYFGNEQFISKREQGFRLTAAVGIWIAADFNIQDGAAHPTRNTLAYHSHNALDRTRFGPHTCLALIIGKPTQAARI